jgi:hypothetical protein
MSKIVVVVSVDWEGRSLLPENLQLIATFRRRHPDVPMQHFLNPAYYTRAKSDAERTTRAIQQTLLPEDEHGLHIHAWHSLVSAAGVLPRTKPRFLDTGAAVPKAADDWGFYTAEDGYDVPIEHFEVGELDLLIKTCVQLLTAHGFRRPTSFRAGGWMSGPRVQSALIRNAFALDCSAVDPQLSIRRFGDIPLCRWLMQLWPAIGETSQPYRLSSAQGTLWQVPDNAGLVDYTSVDELMGIFESNVGRWLANPSKPQLIVTGFHQETARKYLDRLEEGLARMKDLAAQGGWPLVFTSRPQEFLHEEGVCPSFGGNASP